MTTTVGREASRAADDPPTHGRRRLSPVTREAIATSTGSVLLALAMTWPTMRHPTTAIEHNYGDPALSGWLIAWGRHALFANLWHPAAVWNGNTFFPEPLSYAFTESMIGYWPFNLVGSGPAAAILTVNLVYVFATALATVGGYALTRQLGASWLAAAAAGLASAYAPWRLIHAGHLHVISTGGILLALAFLARGHGWSLRRGYEPERTSPGFAVAGWLVACWQITVAFGIGIPFGYLLGALAIACPILWWRSGRPRIPRRLLLADIGGLAAFGITVVLMAVPYLKVVERFPYGRRSEADLAFYSPPLQGFFVGPSESRIYGDLHEAWRATLSVPAEMTLLPGYVLYAAAAVGLFFSVWTLRQRLLLFAAAIVSIWLAMGTNTPDGGLLGYLTLYRVLPGFDAIRTPGRMVIWITLILSLLAAGAVTRMHEGLRRQGLTPRWQPGPLIAGAVALLILVEGLSALPNPTVPPEPAAMRAEHADVVRPPLLVLPSDQATDALVMLWSTDRFPAVVNGSSGLTPVSQVAMRTGTVAFPDAASIALLRGYGVRTVIVLRDRIAGTPWAGAADASVDGLDITRTEIDNAVVYDLG